MFLALLIPASSQGQTAPIKPLIVKAHGKTTPDKKTVLLLFSYQADLPATKLAVQGIQSEFSNAHGLTLDMFYEYMDINRFSDNAYQKQLLSLYIAKYRNKTFDLVIVSSEKALIFWMEHRSEIAPNTPMVIYDVVSDHLAVQKLPPDVTGVTADIDHAQSVKWILQARPSINEIVIVHGVGKADQEFIHPVDALKDHVGRPVKWSDWSNLPLTEIKRRASNLPPSAVVLYQLMLEDAAGVKYRPIEALREMASVSSVPVLSSYDQFIGAGTIGGYMYSIEEQARQTARLGLRILRGEPASAIPINTMQGNRFIFDHLALLRWNIPLSALPPDSIVKNRQYSLWESYRPYVITAGAAFSVLLLLVVILVALNMQLKTARLALGQLNVNLEAQVQERTEKLRIANTALTAEITERKQMEERLRHMATHDFLTGLPTLRLATDRLKMALSMARRNKTMVAVLFIDLDGFKSVNDDLGHEAGDQVLMHVARRLLSCLREMDTVARVGGDEFLLIATGIHEPKNASQIAENIIHQVSQPIMLDKGQALVGASVGISLYPMDSEDMDQLIKLADEAMYRVKKAGKNGFCFTNNT